MDPALVAVAGALLALLGVLSGHILHRVNGLEDDLRDAQDFNRRLWHYTRRLLDLYYRHRAPGSPDPEPLPEE